MAEPFIGQIIQFGGNFAIRGYALCNGQILSIAQNTALFSILGTTYGGDGQQTFGLPDLRGRVAIHFGQGPGLSDYQLGQRAGTENTTLVAGNLPAHNHPVYANAGAAGGSRPAGTVLANSGGASIYAAAPDGTQMNAGMIGNTGSSQPISILQPYLAINFLIALEGIFPSRN